MSQAMKYMRDNDLKRKDAVAPISLQVIARDVTRAKKKSATHCALSLAACRAIPEATSAHFFKSIAYIERSDGTMTRYRLPPSVQKEIVCFDRTGEFEPGVYQLSTFTKSQTLESLKSRRGAKTKRKNNYPKNVHRRKTHVTTNVRTAFEGE